MRWTTPAGEVTTNTSVKSELTLPELHHDKVIQWSFHVTKSLGAYDMIIGRDLLEFLGIDIKFSTKTVEWDSALMPFKDVDDIAEAFHIDEPPQVVDASDRLKRILDAKYEAADLEAVVQLQEELNASEKQMLLQLLTKYEHLFDGTLGKWTGTKVELELNEGATPYHARAFPIPKIHLATLKLEVERLCQLGVLKRVNRSQWAAPTFVIPKKDGSVRFISDFRELNKRIKRKPYPIPNIQDMLLNLEGFKYATSLDLNMGYYHLELDDRAKELCTIVLPFGKFEYQRTPMGLCNSPDIFQEKMCELFHGLDYVRAYIDDLLCLTKGDFRDHLEKLEMIFSRLTTAGLKVNANKSFFGRAELEYLGYWITRDGIQPLQKKVEAIMHIAEPKNRKELRSFIGVVNYYRDMWFRRSHVLAPLARLTSKTVKWSWGEKERAAFSLAKRIIAKETILAYPDFSKPFTIHTDASHYQLGGVISQDNKPVAFYSRKLNDAQTRYTTTERELLSIVETLKAYRNILLGHQIIVHTDHKNLVYKTFNTERVMRWRLLIEEFGPELRYIKGELNVVADVLSRLDLKEEEFSLDAFALDEVEKDGYPLAYSILVREQQADKTLSAKIRELEKVEATDVKDRIRDPTSTQDEVHSSVRTDGTNTPSPSTDVEAQQPTDRIDRPNPYPEFRHKEAPLKKGYALEERVHSDKKYKLLTKDGKICVPKSIQPHATKWYHYHLCHPGETRLELTLRQHYDWPGLKTSVRQTCTRCPICAATKPKSGKYGKLPPKKNPESIPWHTLCIDLIGPYKFGPEPKEGKADKRIALHCLTMIDPATGWFEIARIDSRRADYMANYLEFAWLTRYPWPSEVVLDRGSEFKAEVKTMLHAEYGCKAKLITSRNPQANSIVERVHGTVHNMVRSHQIKDKNDLDPRWEFEGILGAVRKAVNSTVHTTLRATPTQLVFGRDAMLNVSFQANWEYIRDRKQKLIIQNNERENKKRRDHTYSIGDKVMIQDPPNRKHGADFYKGPFTVSKVNDNGTVELRRDAEDGGALSETWNIRNIYPRKA